MGSKAGEYRRVGMFVCNLENRGDFGFALQKARKIPLPDDAYNEIRQQPDELPMHDIVIG
jgi:hypothetical protein